MCVNKCFGNKGTEFYTSIGYIHDKKRKRMKFFFFDAHCVKNFLSQTENSQLKNHFAKKKLCYQKRATYIHILFSLMKAYYCDKIPFILWVQTGDVMQLHKQCLWKET